MRSRPPKRLSPDQEQAAEAFIDAAEEEGEDDNQARPGPDETRKPSRKRPVYPWEEPHVREDVTQGYPLRLPEPLYLKLKYVSEKTGCSMNQLCNDVIEDMVEEKLSELLSEEPSF